MIKARGKTADGRDACILGLSYGNIGRLMDGQPISFDGTPYGFAGEVVIFAGKTEEEMGALIMSENPGIKVHREKDAP